MHIKNIHSKMKSLKKDALSHTFFCNNKMKFEDEMLKSQHTKCIHCLLDKNTIIKETIYY